MSSDESKETLEQLSDRELLLNLAREVRGISKRLDGYDAQFEAIRQGIVDNNIRLDRLEGNFHLLRAEVSTLVEEVRHNRKVLV